MSEELFVPSEVGLKSRSIDISSYTKQLKPLFAVLYHWSFGIPLVLVFFCSMGGSSSSGNYQSTVSATLFNNSQNVD